MGDAPEDTVNVTGPVHSGAEVPGPLGSEEQAVMAQLRATIHIRIHAYLTETPWPHLVPGLTACYRGKRARPAPLAPVPYLTSTPIPYPQGLALQIAIVGLIQ